MMSNMFCQVYVATNRLTRTACRNQTNDREPATGSLVIIEANEWNRRDTAAHRQIKHILEHRRNI